MYKLAVVSFCDMLLFYRLGVSDASVQPVTGIFSFEIIPSVNAQQTSTLYELTSKFFKLLFRIKRCTDTRKFKYKLLVNNDHL